MLRRYEFRERWHMDAPIDRVWPIIRDISTYPTWWSQFVEAKRLNDVDGVGALIRVHAKSALPYHMYFEAEAVREEPPRLAEVQVRGDLNGSMKWMLAPEGAGTRLDFEEIVITGKPLLNLLAPLFKPFFSWNHAIMMRRGQQGLRRLLAGKGA